MSRYAPEKKPTLREHSPRIYKQRFFSNGITCEIRKYFFYNQFDLKYGQNVNRIRSEQWTKEWMIELLERTIKTDHAAYCYGWTLVTLPNVQSYGHHTASSLLGLETTKCLQQNK